VSQCDTHYTRAGNGEVPDIVVHTNIRLSERIFSDSLVSCNLPTDFHKRNNFRTRYFSNPVT